MFEGWSDGALRVSASHCSILTLDALLVRRSATCHRRNEIMISRVARMSEIATVAGQPRSWEATAAAGKNTASMQRDASFNTAGPSKVVHHARWSAA